MATLRQPLADIRYTGTVLFLKYVRYRLVRSFLGCPQLHKDALPFAVSLRPQLHKDALPFAVSLRLMT
jgi:hypothetical protein